MHFFCAQKLAGLKKVRIFAPAFETNVSGVIAQLVEQRTVIPCVPGSIPGGTTKKRDAIAPLFYYSVYQSGLDFLRYCQNT